MNTKKAALLSVFIFALGYIFVQTSFFGHPPIALHLFHSKKLYRPLNTQKINLAEEGSSQTIDFKVPYRGNYEIGFTFKNLSSQEAMSMNHRKKSSLKLPLKLKVELFDGDKLIKSQIVEDKDFSFFSAFRRESGFGFLLFKAPEEVPLRKLIQCKITILSPDLSFEQTYGPTMAYVQMLADC